MQKPERVTEMEEINLFITEVLNPIVEKQEGIENINKLLKACSQGNPIR